MRLLTVFLTVFRRLSGGGRTLFVLVMIIFSLKTYLFILSLVDSHMALHLFLLKLHLLEKKAGESKPMLNISITVNSTRTRPHAYCPQLLKSPRIFTSDQKLVHLFNRIAAKKIERLIQDGRPDEHDHGENSLLRSAMNNRSSISNHLNLADCPEMPPHLLGDLNISFHNANEIWMEDIIVEHFDIQRGGQYTVPNCISRHKVGIIIPYRNRFHHLEILLHYLLPIWKRQLLSFRVFVVEQYGNGLFNKGRLMNSGFIEATMVSDFQCFIFHDVDMIPENDYVMYSCPYHPRHMAVAVDELEYSFPYHNMVGGVLSIRTGDFLKVNGYSNRYWGWGGEDDDMGIRLLNRGLHIDRLSSNVMRYRMIPHTKRPSTSYKTMFKRLHDQSHAKVDGLKSLRYKLMAYSLQPLYTHIVVDIGDT